MPGHLLAFHLPARRLSPGAGDCSGVVAFWQPAILATPPRLLRPSRHLWVLILQLGTSWDSCSPWHPGPHLADVPAGCRRNASIVLMATWGSSLGRVSTAGCAVLWSWAGGMSPSPPPAPPLPPPLPASPLSLFLVLLVFFLVYILTFSNSHLPSFTLTPSLDNDHSKHLLSTYCMTSPNSSVLHAPSF